MRFLDKPPKIIQDIKRETVRRIRIATETIPGVLSGVSSYEPRELPPDDVLTSAEFNLELRALSEELKGVYAQVSALEVNSLQQKNVINQAFHSTKGAILKVINDLRVHQFLKLNPRYQAVRFVDFHTARNETKISPTAIVDPDTRILKLAVTDKRVSQLVHPTRGEARVDIQHHGGGVSGSLIQDFSPERMLDTDDSTFWADLIVTQEPIVQTYQTSGGRSRQTRGLVSDIAVTLNETTTINNLRVLPFAEYPLVIIDIAYKASISQDHWVQISDFSEEPAGLDWIELQFRPIRAAQIRITLLQENYIKGIYHLPERMVHATNLLEHAIPSVYRDRVGTTGLSDAEVAAVAVAPEMLTYLESLRDLSSAIESAQLPRESVREYELATDLLKKVGRILAKPDLTDAIDLLEPAGYYPPEEDEKLIEVKTTEYMVGIRTLEVSTVRYAPVSYYASPEFHPSSTPISISIEVDEKHSEFEEDGASYRLTSVDYEIDLGEGLRFPILPASSLRGGIPIVQDEFVSMDRHNMNGYTRFRPVSSSFATVRKNGVRLPPSEYTLSNVLIGYTADVGKLTINESSFSPTAIYTLTYVPDAGASDIVLPDLINSTPVRVPEIFNGTDEASRIRTKYVPHIVYGIINDEVKWSKRLNEGVWDYLPEATTTLDGVEYSSTANTYEPVIVLVNNVKARNLTDYARKPDDGRTPAFTSSTEGDNVYDYFQVGSEFYFNKTIVDQQITIQYNWMVQYVQLLATLRCFKQAGVDITPRVNDFHIRLETSTL